MKEVRITARVPIGIYNDIHKAAELIGVPVNAYITQVAHEAALKKIDETESARITLSAKDSYWFLEQINKPSKPNRKLIGALDFYRHVGRSK